MERRRTAARGRGRCLRNSDFFAYTGCSRPHVIETLTFAQAVWLFCPAFVLHLLEEWPRFTGWARLHASARFTQRDYNVIHAAGVAMSLLAALIVSRFPN